MTERDKRIRTACKDVLAKYVKLSPYSAVEPDEKIGKVIKIMKEKSLGSVLVRENDELLGIFTERDVLNKIAGNNELFSSPVSEFMRSDPVTLTGDDKLRDAIALMIQENCRRIPILDKKGRCAGILHTKHILDCLVDYFQDEIYNLPPTPDQVYRKEEGG